MNLTTNKSATIYLLILCMVGFLSLQNQESEIVVPSLDKISRVELVQIESSYLINVDTLSSRFQSLPDSVQNLIRNHEGMYGSKIFKTLIKRSYIDTTRIGNRVELSLAEIKQVRELLNKPPELKGERVESECYVPRHGILFYNKKNEIDWYLEFCFECGIAKKWNNKKIKLKLDQNQWIGIYEVFETKMQ